MKKISTPNYLLRRARQERGWSQQELAERIGASQAFLVTRWERGIATPSPHYQQKICELFDTDAMALGLRQQETPPAFSDPSLSLYDPAIPFSLSDSHTLVGRADLLTQLKRRLCDKNCAPHIALSGMPGVGKTVLTVALASDPEIQEHFQDGILWSGLGPDPNSISLLSRWGILLGMSKNETQGLRTLDDWMMTVHALIGKRRMLLIIDDVWSIEHALLFKLGGSSCAHLLTTRLPDVATRFAREGTFPVEELSIDDGFLLLKQLAPAAVKMEEEEARVLVQAVGGLPLALTLMGNYLSVESRHHQRRRIRAALSRLRRAEERLSIKQPQTGIERHPGLSETPYLSLQAVIGVSDHVLDEASRQTFYALSVFPAKPNTFSEEAALAVAASSPQVLDILVDAGLVESIGPDRYTIHQTIADYARLHLKDSFDPTLYRRIVEYMVGFIQANEKNYEILEAENANILTALQFAQEQGYCAELLQGTLAYIPLLQNRGMYGIAEEQLERAYRATSFLENEAQKNRILLFRGEIARKRGYYIQAEHFLREGLALVQQTEGREHMSAFLYELGVIAHEQGDYAKAEMCSRESLILAQQFADHERASLCLTTLGLVARKQGHYEQAESLFEEAMMLARRFHYNDQLSQLLTFLGAMFGEQGKFSQEEQCLQEGLNLALSSKNRINITRVLASLGILKAQQGQYEQAELHLQESLTLARQFGRPSQICHILLNLGAMAGEQGNYEQAETHFQEGLSLARELRHREHIGLFLLNLGDLAFQKTNYEQAETYFQEGLALGRELGHTWLTCTILGDIGEMQIKQQMFDAASKTFHEILEHAPAKNLELFGVAQYGLAQVAAAQEKKDEAIQFCTLSHEAFTKIEHKKIREVKQLLDTLLSR